MKRYWLALLVAMLFNPLFAHAAKPQSPLQVSISPIQSDLASAAIKPGDIIELKITATTFVDAGELDIKVELHGNVELISGETSWTGSAKKGEGKVLVITVRAPMQENGAIKARISMSPSSGAKFAAEAEYRLGQNALKKPAQLPKIKKDSKGRELREYRVN